MKLYRYRRQPICRAPTFVDAINVLRLVATIKLKESTASDISAG